MEEVKVAVIGLGTVAQLIHLPILQRMPKVRISAVCETNKNRLKTVSERFSVTERFTDFNQLIESTDYDAIIISTPTSTHKEIALRAIDKGKPVFIEKPVSRSFAESKAIADFSKEKNVPVMVGMNLRFRPDLQLLKSIIKTKQLNDIFYLRSAWFRPQSSDSQWFRKREESGGGVIFDLGIVMLDMVLWLLDFPEIDSVTTRNYYHNTRNVEDSSISYIRCSSGTTIVTESSWSMRSEKNTFNLELFAKDGSASLNPLRVFKKNRGIDEELNLQKFENSSALFTKSYHNEMKSFIDAVRGVNTYYSPVSEAPERMKIIEAMYKSAESNKEIRF